MPAIAPARISHIGLSLVRSTSAAVSSVSAAAGQL